MLEATEKDLRAAEQALYHAMHLARAALHTMENVELLDAASNDPRGLAVHAVAELLATIERDAEAAGDKLGDLEIGGNHA
jgi:hypothetical protein